MRHRTRQRLTIAGALPLLALATILLSAFPLYSAAHDEHAEQPKQPASCSVLGWVPYWDQKQAIDSFRQHAGTIDYLSLFWYNLTPEGTVRRYKHAEVDQGLIDLAHENGTKVFALVANLPDDQREGGDYGWDPDRVGAVIGSEQARAAHIEELVTLAEELGVDGINID